MGPVVKAAYLFVAVMLCALSGATDARAEQKFSWEAVPDAHYYRGIVARDGKKMLFRTSDLSLVLRDNELLYSLVAYNAQRQRIGKVLFSSSPTKEPATVLPPPPEPEEVEEVDDYSSEPDVEEDDAPFFDRGSFNIASADRATATSRLLFGISLGFGKETLTAKGGISELDSTSSVGGTHARFMWTSLQGSVPTYGFSLDAGAHVHSTTVEEQEDLNSLEKTEKEYNFFRSYYELIFRIFADRWLSSQKHFMNFGLGLGGFRIPIMKITNDESGLSSAEMQGVLGPELAYNYVWQYIATQSLEVDLRYMLLGFGELRTASRLNSYVTWNYHFDEFKAFAFGLGIYRDKAQKTIDCPAVTSCEETANSTGASQKIHVGLKLTF